MISFLIDIILGVGLGLVGFCLHKSAVQRPDPKFGRVDFLFAYIMYLTSIGRFLSALELKDFQFVFFGTEIIVVYYLLILMIKLVPKALKEPTRAKLVEQTINATMDRTIADDEPEIKARTRDEIYNEIMNERIKRSN